MSIRTSSSKLKANLGRYMKAVRAGKAVIVTDRGEPVARLVPYRDDGAQAGLEVVRPRDPSAPALGEVEVRPIGYRGRDTTAMLAEDRRP